LHLSTFQVLNLQKKHPIHSIDNKEYVLQQWINITLFTELSCAS